MGVPRKIGLNQSEKSKKKRSAVDCRGESEEG